MKRKESLINSFREKGLKITPQRLAIFKILENNSSHPSADEIYCKLKKNYPTISLATVYKTLEVLEMMGEVKLLKSEHGGVRFDPDCSSHHHFICKICNKIFDIKEDYSYILKSAKRVKDLFKIEDFRVEFFGTCKDCQIKRKKKSKIV
ncbi:MAG: hypothetical protein AMJ90_03905 [candidate division Zixibacteria bacterium SM23_73_2]|nr:MAG: hypothetical protein AMJ90_03905 [candidate division Zixibacteria bacterium SM23_73_2]